MLSHLVYVIQPICIDVPLLHPHRVTSMFDQIWSVRDEQGEVEVDQEEGEEEVGG
jgi:hypothetical protein